jgi:hypothetical protein
MIIERFGFPLGRPFWLMVDQGRINDLGHHFQQAEATQQWFSYLVFAAIPLMAVTAGFLVHHYATRVPSQLNSSEALLGEICVAHRIDASDQRLLLTLADRAGVAQPAVLVAIPEVFDAAFEKATAEKPWKRGQAERLTILRRQLFADVRQRAG